MPAEAPILHGLNLITKDMKTTLAFYRLLGIEIPQESVWGSGGGHHVEVQSAGGLDFALDSEDLAKAYNAAWQRPEGAGRTLIGFRVNSREAVDETFTTLTAAGHTGLQEPYDAFWGSRCAVIEDPDGRDVAIMSAPEDAFRSAPPDL
ncbi:MAG: glyoxalase [Gammaproteobacteria bacterium]|nr:MAG: glyoxalase [Gammaproteobacteria bacterium]